MVFDSDANNLVPNDTNNPCPDIPPANACQAQDIFLADRTAGTLSRISVSSTGEEANGASNGPKISSDGHFVIFSTGATNLIPGDPGGGFVEVERETGVISRVSVSSEGVQGDSGGFYSSISSDGRFVAFSSYADNLVTGDTNSLEDIFVHDRLIGTTSLVSSSSTGTLSNGPSDGAAISGDGNVIAFESSGTNLVSGDNNHYCFYSCYEDVFAHQMDTGETTLVSISGPQPQANAASSFPSVTTDGRYIVFASRADNIVPGDTNYECDEENCADIFLRDRLTGTTTRLTVNSHGEQANGASADPWISPDGHFVVFTSSATNLIDSDPTGGTFLLDRQTGQLSRISSMSFTHPSLSANGRYVVFASTNNTLVPNDFCDLTNFENSCSDIFLYDRQTSMVSVSSAGMQGDHDSYDPTMSADGRYITFTSDADNLVANDHNNRCYSGNRNCPDVFLHDMQTGTTTLVSVSSSGVQGDWFSFLGSITPSGRYVVFDSFATNLVPGDTDNRLDVFVRDIQTNKTTRASVSSTGAQINNDEYPNYSDSFADYGRPSISDDGRFVVFHSLANNLVPGDTNNQQDIFVSDLETHRIARVNIATTGAQADGSSDFESISTDGRFIVFRSTADNLVPGYQNRGVANLFFVENPIWTALDAPARNYFTTLPVILTWSPVTGAVAYEVQMSSNSDFSGATTTPVDATPYLSIDTLDNGTYYWRVHAQDGTGKWGAWSTSESFTLAVP